MNVRGLYFEVAFRTGSIRAMSTFILAFDHRNSLLTTFFEVTGEPTDPEVAAGASRQREFDEGREYWLVMQDPEGNEFCIQ